MLARNFDLVAVLCALVSMDRVLMGQLIRPRHAYQSLIRGIHDYFNNTCIILLHGVADPVESQDLREGDGLLALQIYLSTVLHIRTSIMDFEMFKRRVGLKYYHIKRPLFVVLNDHEEVRRQFAHVSTWIAMAYPTWLIFFSGQTRVEEFFADIYVPFDCKLMIARANEDGTGELIMEVYQVDRGKELRTMKFGTWDPIVGFRGPNRSLYQRRNDLYGHTIRITTVHDPPLSMVHRDNRNRPVGMNGFFGHVIRLVQESINCTFSFHEAGTWGVLMPNGSWTGAIGMLINGEADLAATELVMSSDRLDFIEFTTPVYSTKSRAYIKRPNSMAVKWQTYAAPFDKSIWNALVILIIFASATISTIKAAVRIIRSYLVDYKHSSSRFADILFNVFGAFCSQAMELSLLDPVRIVQLVVHLTAVVVLAAYSAALISFLAVKPIALPFTTMEGLLNDGTYRFGVIGESADYSFFQNSSDKIINVLFDRLLTKEESLPSNYLDGLMHVCHENKYAFMTLDNMAAVLQRKIDCVLEPLDVISQVTIAMATARQSPYRGIINSRILLLRDSGIMQRLLKTEWSTELSKPTSAWTSVELEDVLPLLIFLLAIMFACFFFLSLERLLYNNLLASLTLERKRAKRTRLKLIAKRQNQTLRANDTT